MKKGLLIILMVCGLLSANQEREANIKGLCFSYMSEYSIPGYYLGYRFNDNFEILGGYSVDRYNKKEEYNSSLTKEYYEEKTETYGIKYYYVSKENLHLYLGAFTLKGANHFEYETEYTYSNKQIENSSFSGNKFCLGAQYFLNSEKFAFNIEYGQINKDFKGTNEDETTNESDTRKTNNYSYSAFGISCYF